MSSPVSLSAPPPSTPVFVSREISWLAFNERVLEEANDPSNPLLERLRFLLIFHTNLDEFFMIRVSGIKQQIAAGVEVPSVNGQSPRSHLVTILDRVRELSVRASALLLEELLPALAAQGLEVVNYDQLAAPEREVWDDWYRRKVHPILTPLAVGPAQPFPFISNLSLNLATLVRGPNGEERFARVKMPLANLPRLIPLRPDGELTLPLRVLPIEQLVAANLGSLFPGMTVSRPWVFRVTRDADLELKEDEADDLLQALQQELRRRRFGQAVRLEVQAGTPPEILEALLDGLSLEHADILEVRGPLGVPRLDALLKVDRPDLKYPPFVPRVPRALRNTDPFSVLRQQDVLLHHPFDAFSPMVDFLRRAAADPAVVAIKQTLYRTSGNSPVIRALEEAIDNGKQVAAVVELKARFDEENNIGWAQRLEAHGVHVVYGVPRLKTHAKLCMVVRREGEELVRYCHIGTGNYNETTARVYTDLGLFTSRPEIAADVAELFNMMTGYSEPERFQKLWVAPRTMKRNFLAAIAREAEAARQGLPSGLLFKCNAIVDQEVIQALYDASQAGVPIKLLVRGMCCLVPGIPLLSETIEVRSVVGRFLEHSRVYWFANRGQPRCYVGSADLMGRNLVRRVEVLTPVEDPQLLHWIREVLLERYLADTARSRLMGPDGRYVRLTGTSEAHDVQLQFLRDLTR